MGVVGADEFREVMAAMVAPVSVVTSRGNGEPHRTTVSAVASLSLDPPNGHCGAGAGVEPARLCPRYQTSRGQRPRSLPGAHRPAVCPKGSSGFDPFPWQEQQGLPRPQEAPVWLACEVEREVEGGDHVILLIGGALALRCLTIAMYDGERIGRAI